MRKLDLAPGDSGTILGGVGVGASGSTWLCQPPSTQHVVLWPYSRSVGQKGIENDPSRKWQPLPSPDRRVTASWRISKRISVCLFGNEDVPGTDLPCSGMEKYLVDLGGDKRTT